MNKEARQLERKLNRIMNRIKKYPEQITREERNLIAQVLAFKGIMSEATPEQLSEIKAMLNLQSKLG